MSDRECSESCVDALRQICDVMLDKLVKCARYQSSIGVDVAAEERQRKAEECLQVRSLFQLFLFVIIGIITEKLLYFVGAMRAPISLC